MSAEKPQAEQSNDLIQTLNAYRQVVRDVVGVLSASEKFQNDRSNGEKEEAWKGAFTKLEIALSDYAAYSKKQELPAELKQWIDEYNPEVPRPEGLSELQTHVSMEAGYAAREIRGVLKARGDERATAPMNEIVSSVRQEQQNLLAAADQPGFAARVNRQAGGTRTPGA